MKKCRKPHVASLDTATFIKTHSVFKLLAHVRKEYSRLCNSTDVPPDLSVHLGCLPDLDNAWQGGYQHCGRSFEETYHAWNATTGNWGLMSVHTISYNLGDSQLGDGGTRMRMHLHEPSMQHARPHETRAAPTWLIMSHCSRSCSRFSALVSRHKLSCLYDCHSPSGYFPEGNRSRTGTEGGSV